MKRLLCAVLVLFAFARAFALETSLGEFLVTSENDVTNVVDTSQFTPSVFSALSSLDTKGSVGFRYHPGADTKGIVRSTIDAAQACEINGWETLVYGALVQKAASLEVEIHIYSHPDRKVVRTILLRSTLDDYQSLISDAAQKIYGYFADFLSLAKTQPRYTGEQNSAFTDHGAFWWGTIKPWTSALVPIVGYRGLFSVRLGNPIWTNGEWVWLQEFGIYTRFSYATGAEGVISSHLYDGEIGPLLGWDFVWQRQHEIFMSLVPVARVHFLNYQALYSDAVWNEAVWYGGIFDAGYRIWVNPQRTFGFAVDLGVSAFATDPFFFEYHVGASVIFKGAFK